MSRKRGSAAAEPLMPTREVGKVLTEIVEERKRQLAKWGEQDHPSTNGSDHIVAFWRTAPQLRPFFQRRADEAAARGDLTWADILLEEVFEALAEDDVKPLRAELVQVAAVVVAWIENLDRRAK